MSQNCLQMPLSTLAHIKRCLRRRRKQFQRVSPPARQFALEGTPIITPEAVRSRIWSPMGGQQYHLQEAARAVRVSSDVVPGSGRPTMDFRPREARFFGDNFFKLVTIRFKFSHYPFQPKRRYPSIWSLNKISKFRVPVIDP